MATNLVGREFDKDLGTNLCPELAMLLTGLKQPPKQVVAVLDHSAWILGIMHMRHEHDHSWDLEATMGPNG